MGDATFSAGAIVLACVSIAHSSAAASTVLDADFENSPVGEPIQTRGAEWGEPVVVDNRVTAIVRDGILQSPCLEIADASSNANRSSVIFEFLDGITLTRGEVRVSLTVIMLDQRDEAFDIGIGGEGCRIHVLFNEEGYIQYYDWGVPTYTIGQYVIGAPYELELVVRMWSGDYDLHWNGEVITEMEPLDCAVPNFLDIRFSQQIDVNIEGRACIDDLRIRVEEPTVIENVSWGRIRSAYYSGAE